uniref:Uncharacterized protein, isoform A n=1 Tax=Drosophila melanogaster TaxID=7227 RepID=Q0E976_DROME|nr:uncharacterized protein Dmel_CG10151, isoform C [Drosophila melanogaster]NP_725414.1 uncharacterized protein Dmel_CG10151, isoform A [Drosophila melanogaster]NP_725415.1 uncharacterized protein Dmel_CG10151, isoform B [Drosophila melanogaster]AAF58211.2 uncharacterized protein Dmel_CG10151, isoform C [Drosophila melanogaster]AAM68549.1 uncharacterized protein Dmel_CG10151, isoform A [Drosophila melanogaster]AAM68550.1 uncharacterized protein Dmel_CG10151, isoform B [Drosophila melanogaster]|eukprot:NP_610984.2 uncharacterized protein Dmel_CG10151, isoform C [Drosophila melanogaster]
MSLKSSARIKKRRSEAAAATYPVPSAPAQTVSNGSAATANPASATSTPGNGATNPCQSSSKKQSFVGRNPNFDTDETKLLIQLWGDPKLQRTLITTHKKHAVICQLAAKMQEYGYHRSPEEITTRIKNLKCFYNRLKKDKECGGQSTDSEPSWKHFAEMDAIMTRPIFSVRPNEVPAPSLKYQLEQALEEHAERRKRRLANGEELSESDNEEDDMLLSALVSKNKDTGGRKELEAGCLEADSDMNEESFSKRRKVSADVEVDIGEALTSPCIKIEPGQEVETAAATSTVEPQQEEEDDDCMILPQPKEEPIDVDAADDPPIEKSSSSTTNTSTLADMLQGNKPSNLLPFTGANVIIPASITTTTAGTSATTQSSTTTSSKLQGGKISLVPANFLMQSKLPAAAGPSPMANAKGAAPQIQLLQSAINQGARLMISGSAAAPAQPSNAGLVATAPGGVKFVLVNAEQAKAAAAAAAVGKSTASLPLSTAQAQVQAAVQQQQQKLHQSLQQEQHHQQHIQLEKEESRHDHEKAMRILLRQLLNSQNEANEIQHNRLSLERERLDWEKSMGERLLNLLPSLMQPPPAASPCSTAQRLQPPKLLFTTALPMGNGTVTMPHILTSNSLPKVITTSSCNSGVAVAGSGVGLVASVAPKPVDNDVQLISPKLEKEI